MVQKGFITCAATQCILFHSLSKSTTGSMATIRKVASSEEYTLRKGAMTVMCAESKVEHHVPSCAKWKVGIGFSFALSMMETAAVNYLD